MQTSHQPFWKEIRYHDPLTWMSAIAQEPWTLLLDSANHAHPLQTTNRYSYVATDPFTTFVVKDHHTQPDLQPVTDVFTTLKQLLAPFKLTNVTTLPPFQGGVAGYFAYDLGHELENIAHCCPRESHFPDLALGFYDTVIAFDHLRHKAWIISSGFPELTQSLRERRAHQRIQQFEHLIMQGLANQPTTLQYSTHDTKGVIESNFDQTTYQHIVEQAKQYILNGDIFEVNLSQRFHTSMPPNLTGFSLYQKLRTANPAPFSAYLHFDQFTLASASPERFLQLTDHQVETRPIKGTLARGHTEVLDQQLAHQLSTSAKDRAENIMIVDLMRNDLSKVCTNHSIQVPILCGLESYTSVHHLVSVVTATLMPEQDAIDLLAAAFPGGSITGAPKIRAMEIIAELESHRRGPYCGSLGFISFNGDMDCSILIRTYCIENNTITYQTGGAVVLASDPVQEYQETLDKVAALHQLLLGET
ncbi:MAG: aminodeoxychorismate synthase component I [Legionellales bacterium]|nr:aminodeoxychorismate synthase component I [Legionellales bacterium]